MSGDRALAISPPLWAEGVPVGQRTRKPVSVEESLRRIMEFRAKVSR